MSVEAKTEAVIQEVFRARGCRLGADGGPGHASGAWLLRLKWIPRIFCNFHEETDDRPGSL